MAIQKVRYNSGKEILNVKIETDQGAILEKWKIMLEDFPEWAKIIKRKYGLGKTDKDLDWAK